MLDAQTLQQILEAVTQKQAYPTPDQPRVGGVNDTGAWTGFGAADDHSTPRTNYCMRKLKMSESRSYSQVTAIEEKCRGGLTSIGGPLFCLETEADAKKVVTTIHNFEDFLETHGLEPVFNIVTASAKINMLKQPGLLTAEVITTWIEDLKINGVPDGTGGRLTVCAYDRMNLDWSYDAVMNSCSDALQRELKSNLTASQHTGPAVLFEIYQIVYRQNDSKVEDITKQIEALNIRDFPGQNVTLYKQKCDRLLEELEMNLPAGQTVPTLRNKALKGLSHSTFPFFQGLIFQKLMDNSLDPNRSTVLGVKSALKEIHDTYIVLVQQKNYPPGQQLPKEESKMKAMQAEVKSLKDELTKLSQDRSATSTAPKSPGRNFKTGQKCHGCGGLNHFKGDPECPLNKNKSNGSSNGSSKPSGILKNSDKQVRFNNPPGSNGLTADQNSEVSRLIKEKMKTLPDRKQISDDAVYEIEVNGQVLAKYCKKCRRFTRGDKKHSTSEHNKSKFKTKASGLMAAETVKSAPSPPPASESAPVCVPIRQPVAYDFGSSASHLQRSGHFLAQSVPDAPTEQSDDESVASVDHRLLATLGRAYPKGLGRQG